MEEPGTDKKPLGRSANTLASLTRRQFCQQIMQSLCHDSKPFPHKTSTCLQEVKTVELKLQHHGEREFFCALIIL